MTRSPVAAGDQVGEDQRVDPVLAGPVELDRACRSTPALRLRTRRPCGTRPATRSPGALRPDPGRARRRWRACRFDGAVAAYPMSCSHALPTMTAAPGCALRPGGGGATHPLNMLPTIAEGFDEFPGHGFAVRRTPSHDDESSPGDNAERVNDSEGEGSTHLLLGCLSTRAGASMMLLSGPE